MEHRLDRFNGFSQILADFIWILFGFAGLKFELNSIIPELHSLFLQFCGNCKFYLPQEYGENLKSLL